MWTKKDLEMEFVQYFYQEMTFICPTPPPPPPFFPSLKTPYLQLF